MTNTALAIVFILACSVLGVRGGARVVRPRTAAVLAAVMVAAQLVLLTR